MGLECERSLAGLDCPYPIGLLPKDSETVPAVVDRWNFQRFILRNFNVGHKRPVHGDSRISSGWDSFQGVVYGIRGTYGFLEMSSE
jgi:hypothetical protein